MGITTYTANEGYYVSWMCGGISLHRGGEYESSMNDDGSNNKQIEILRGTECSNVWRQCTCIQWGYTNTTRHVYVAGMNDTDTRFVWWH